MHVLQILKSIQHSRFLTSYPKHTHCITFCIFRSGRIHQCMDSILCTAHPNSTPKFVILLIFAILYSFRTRYQSCSTTNPSYTHFTSLVLVLRLTPLRILESAPFSLHTHYNAITRISFFSNHYNHYRQSEQALGKKLSPMMRI